MRSEIENIPLKSGIDINFSSGIVHDLVDALQFPPYEFNQEYVRKLVRVSSFVGVPQPSDGEDIFSQTGAQAMWTDPSFPESESYIDVFVGADLLAQEKARNFCSKVRNDILEVADRVADFVARAKELGTEIPRNPFARASLYNVGRKEFSPVLITKTDSFEIQLNMLEYLRLMKEWASTRNAGSQSAQIVSADFSFDGYGNSKDAAGDLGRLLPRTDVVKEKKFRDGQSSFDFTKRIPRVVFTAAYSPDGIVRGSLLGFGRMADASGYLIKRNELFSGKTSEFHFSNEDALRDWNRFKPYVDKWVLSFYQTISAESLFFFFDPELLKDEYFSYEVQAFQLQNESLLSVFSIPRSPVILSESQKIMMREQMEQLDPGSGPDTISPWPVVSHFLLGDAKYDWILAGINSRASVDRADPLVVTRKFSYIRAQLEFLFEQSDAGKLFMPANRDITSLVTTSQALISRFGFFQFIRTVLSETGVLYSLDGVDLFDDPLFRETKIDSTVESGIIQTLQESIDSDTGTLDLRSFSSNMSNLLSGEFVTSSDRVSFSRAGAVSSEISMPPSEDPPAASEIKYLNSIDGTRGDLDLMTFDGVSSLMRLVRLYSDIGPNRGPLVAVLAETSIINSIGTATIVPIPESSVQPVDPKGSSQGVGGGAPDDEEQDQTLAKEAAQGEADGRFSSKSSKA